MDSIILHVSYFCRDGMAEPFVKAMKESGLQSAVYQEDGCIQYDYHLSCEKENVVVLLEHWRDKTALEAHFAAETMQKIKQVKEQYVERTEIERFE